MSRARTSVRIAGVLAALLGALFALQGIGLVGGSFMTGQRLWLFIGIVLVVLGVVAASGALGRRRGPRGR